MQDQDDSQKKAQEKTQKENMPNCPKEQPRKNRKSTSPNHIGDNHRPAKMASWLSRLESEASLAKNKENEITDSAEVVYRDTEKATARKNEDLLKFAEILYKCSLCKALPCILTSEKAFLRHIKEHHQGTGSTENQCQHCGLHFQTYSDLQAHSSEAHPVQESENSVMADPVSGQTNSHELLESDNLSSPSSYSDNRRQREAEEQSMPKNQSEEDSIQSAAQHLSNNRHSNYRDDVEVDIKPQIAINSRPSSSTSLAATLEYRSSPELPQRLRMSSSLCGSPPVYPPQPDLRHSPSFGGHFPELSNGFSSSFTPHVFGRHTSMIREGGRCVYFCQVCNEKFQVLKSFQAHCNTDRHHQLVNRVGKNKGRMVFPLSSARETSLRSPLKEVPVVTPQLTPISKGEQSSIEKIAKFFQDHSDLLAHHTNGAAMNNLWASPVNFSLRDRHGGKSDSGEAKSSEKDIHHREKGWTVDKTFISENRTTSPGNRQGCRLKREPGELDVTPFRTKPGDENTNLGGVLESAHEQVRDFSSAPSRKRHAPATTPGSDSSPLSQAKSPSLMRTSSMSSVRSVESGSCQEHADVVSCGVVDHGDSLEHSKEKYSKRDTPPCSNGVKPQEPRTGGESSTPVHRGQARLQKCDKDAQNFCEAQEHTVDAHTSEHHPHGDSLAEENSSTHPDRASHFRQNSATQSPGRSSQHTADSRARDHEITGTEQTTTSVPSTSFTNSDVDLVSQDLSGSTAASKNPFGAECVNSHGSSAAQSSNHAFLDMYAIRQVSLEGSAYVYPSVDEVWYHHLPEAAKDVDLGYIPSRGGEEIPLQDPEDLMDGSKTQNNSEGWKVTKIRDVLRNLITAGGRSSNVSREQLLCLVSRVLRMCEATKWGPACNRAVRDLFPHSLAQRKGKLKKTYFFGLSLIHPLGESKGENHILKDDTSGRPLRDMTQDLEQLLEHLPALLCWNGLMERGVTRDDVLRALEAYLGEPEVTYWGTRCNKAVRDLFPLVSIQRKGKHKTVYFGVDFTLGARKLISTLMSSQEQALWPEMTNNISN